jgi:hypothetical protein
MEIVPETEIGTPLSRNIEKCRKSKGTKAQNLNKVTKVQNLSKVTETKVAVG